MKVLESYGPGVNKQHWCELMGVANEEIRHEMWVEMATVVAKRVVSAELLAVKKYSPSGSELEDLASERLDDWSIEELPFDAFLIEVIGESDYFQDLALGWYERFSFAGEPCGYAHDVVRELKDRLYGYADAQEAITESVVDDFYEMWRTRFVKRVLDEAGGLPA